MDQSILMPLGLLSLSPSIAFSFPLKTSFTGSIVCAQDILHVLCNINICTLALFPSL